MTKLSWKRWPLFRFLDNTFAANFVLPTKRLLRAAGLGVIIAPVGFLIGLDFMLFWLYNGLLLILSLIDLLLLPRRKQLEVVRILPERCDMEQDFRVQIHLCNHGNIGVHVEIKDDLPIEFISSDASLLSRILLETDLDQIVHYTVRSTVRGKYIFQSLYLRYSGAMDLWTKQLKLDQPQQINIYPDLSAVRGILGSLQESLLIDGARIYRKAKLGSEFAHIREYTIGDDPRYINWSATARTRKLMTSDYQPERGKIVMILLDCGRMMGVELEHRMKLDRTLQAAMALAAVALKQGDQVAVLAFSNELKAYLPPGRGIAHLQVILEAVYNLQSDPYESNYSMVLEYVMRNQRKRSLLVLFSDMDHFLFEDQLVPYFKRLRRTHLLLLLSLQDSLLDGWAKGEVKDSRTAFIKSTAQKFMLDRKMYVQQMTRMGIQVLDIPADRLTLSIINYYLEIISREAL